MTNTNTLRDKMNVDIDSIISKLSLLKLTPGYRAKVHGMDRVIDQVEGFIAYWDYKLDDLEQDAQQDVV